VKSGGQQKLTKGKKNNLKTDTRTSDLGWTTAQKGWGPRRSLLWPGGHKKKGFSTQPGDGEKNFRLLHPYQKLGLQEKGGKKTEANGLAGANATPHCGEGGASITAWCHRGRQQDPMLKLKRNKRAGNFQRGD